jgi:exodeoxyribonuclease VII small subunit
MAAPKQNYQDLSSELDEVLDKLQSDDLDVDSAISLYEKGLKLVTELEKRLETAENKVRELKAKQA